MRGAGVSEGRRRLARYRRLAHDAQKLPQLTRAANPYLDIVAALVGPADQVIDHGVAAAMTQLPNWGLSARTARVLELSQRRRELASLFAWAVPSEHALRVAARYAPLVEGGAGMGYWAAMLQARGCDIVACDEAPPGLARNEFHASARQPWTDVRQATSLAAVAAHPNRTLFLCWPPHDDDQASYAVLRRYRGRALVFVGGNSEGAAGTLRFHRELALNWTVVEQVPLPSWPGIPDCLTVFRRNARRRPHTLRDRCFECGKFIATGSIGRCDDCHTRRPPALAIAAAGQRLEYTTEQLAAMPAELRAALENSPDRLG